MINDYSPLIRDAQSAKPRPVGEKQIYKLIHGLYHKAGLPKQNHNGGYDIRVHSIRKFFKTQLMALGLQADYMDYMMGHSVDVYHDIQSKGVDFLRNIYANAGLSIKPRVHVSKIEMVKEFIRGLGMNPEEILIRKAVSEPHRICATSQEQEENQVRALCLALKENLKEELLSSLKSPS